MSAQKNKFEILFSFLIILILCRCSASQGAVNQLSQEEIQQGFKLLFDGKSMDQWRNYKSEGIKPQWQVIDEAMVLTEKGGRDIVTKEKFRFFDLRLDWSISEGGNSGIMFRVNEQTNKRLPWMVSPEYQLKDPYGKPRKSAGALYGLVAAPEGIAKKFREWNNTRILLMPAPDDTSHLKCWLNGTKTVDMIIDHRPESEWSKLVRRRNEEEGVKGTKFELPEEFFKVSTGNILLQDHGNRVSFRNIRIRHLAESPDQLKSYKFNANGESLKYYEVPKWYEDAKFGIYFHWAPFSVAAHKTEWYPRWMYVPMKDIKRDDYKAIPEHHINKWGSLDKFGYKDFIPLFKAQKWNPDEWVELFQKAGAKYVVSAAVHHDGFALWDSEHIAYNSKRMGPERDIVNEFVKAARKAGLKTGVSTHYGRHWNYYTFRPEYDNWDPKYKGLYGQRRGDDDPPRPEDQKHWKDVMIELIDKYEPDYIFVDGGVGDGERQFGKPYFRQEFYDVLAHYYNSALDWDTGVVLTYKREFLEPDQAVEDFERSGMDYIRWSSKWQTDDKISVNGWCYVENTEFWPVDYLIGTLMDIVSKNGNLLLNVGPKPDGTLRQEEVQVLQEIGDWLQINGQAVYGTKPWRTFGEGEMIKISDDGKHGKNKMGPDCVRFTTKKDVLYAACFGWPDSGKFTIKSITTKNPVSTTPIKSIKMVGTDQRLKWMLTKNGLEVVFPKDKPCEYAYVLKIMSN